VTLADGVDADDVQAALASLLAAEDSKA